MINQLLPTISYGDAVSNSAVNMMNALNELGIKSKIYAQNIHPKMSKFASPISDCSNKYPVIYHLSTGSDLAYEIANFKSKKMLIYHNVTPTHFFNGYNGQIFKLCQEGREQLKYLSNYIDFAMADSEYNRLELDQYGYKKTVVSPIIINYSEYAQEPCKKLMKKFQDQPDITNILFVGRIAPNKKQEDIIKTFYYYKTYINPKSKLFLVGSSNGMERYYNELVNLVKHLNLEDVYITGHIPFNQILAYYINADIFLSMSEHEGFCVPLLEAMYFNIPIIAYDSSAIGETLGSGGFLTGEKNYKEVAELINILLSDSELKNNIISNQKQRLKDFSAENTKSIFMKHVMSVIS